MAAERQDDLAGQGDYPPTRLPLAVQRSSDPEVLRASAETAWIRAANAERAAEAARQALIPARTEDARLRRQLAESQRDAALTRDDLTARLNALTESATRQAESLSGTVRQQEASIAELTETLAVQTASLSREIERQKADAAASWHAHEAAVIGLNERIAEEQRLLAGVRASKSYRLGLMAAWVKRQFSTLKRRLRRGAQNPLFDRDYYLDTYPDIRWSGRDPYGHYLAFGASEGRKPNRVFDSRWYFDTYPDVRDAGINPLVHYYSNGAAEGRRPAAEFDGDAYLAKHADAKADGVNPLLHYLQHGQDDAVIEDGRRRILVVAFHAPSRAHAGGLRMLDMYAYLRSIAPDIRLDLFTVRKPEVDWAYDDLPKVFSNVYFAPDADLSVASLRRLSGEETRYDVVDFQFPEAGADIATYRKIAGRTLFTPMELLSRGFAMASEAETAALTPQARAERAEASRREIELCRAVDEVVCVSNPDADFLRKAGLANVTALETGVSVLEFGDLAADAQGRAAAAPIVVFVAYFNSQTNVDALDWYLREVHPAVKAAVPDYRFDVVGRGDLSRFRSRADANTRIVGEVPSVGPAIHEAAVGIAPALGGAGFRGKINQYALLGLPTVASPVAAEGMAYQDGRDIIVGDTAAKFAEGVISLLSDPERRSAFARQARETCLANYSWAAKEDTIRRLYGIERPEPTELPSVTALVPSYSHAPYIEARIRSIKAQTYAKLELVVIDDCSPDESDAVISRLRDELGFTYIRREQNSGTPFSAWEYAAREIKSDYVWICESDDVAEPDFLTTALANMNRAAGAALYYCNSNVIDSSGQIVDTTATYFREVWQDARWQSPFIASGMSELKAYQYRGMTVPNMSSALMTRDAFAKAYGNDLKRFKLTGDWLFVGRLMTHGAVIFDPTIHSNFRRHEQTSRARTQSGQSQAEFIVTKFRLHRLAGKRPRDLAQTLRLDATRFIYEPASGWSVFRAMWRLSWVDTLRIGVTLLYSLAFHRRYLASFLRRKRDYKKMKAAGAA